MLDPDDAIRAGWLLRLARQVTGRHDLDDVLNEVFRCLRPLIEFGGGSIQLLDDEGWIRMAACDPVAPEHVMAQRIPLGTSVAGRVILTEQSVYLADIDAESLPQREGGSRRVSAGVRSYLGVPLVADGRAIGVLQVDSPEPDAWSEAERTVFLCAAPIVAAAIQNARAHVRTAAAQTRVDAVEKQLSDARHVLVAAQRSIRNGDRAELERHLSRIQSLLAFESIGSVDSSPADLPRQRLHEVVPLAR